MFSRMIDRDRLTDSWIFIRQYMWPSLYESIFVLVVSNASIFVLVLMHMASTEGASLSIALIGETINRNVNSSEILVYVLALVAPAAWIMMSHWRGRRHLTFYWVLFLVQAAIVFGSAIIYSMAKSMGIKNTAFADNWAATCVTLGILIWYVTLVYEKWLPKLIEKSREESGKSILDELERDQ